MKYYEFNQMRSLFLISYVYFHYFSDLNRIYALMQKQTWKHEKGILRVFMNSMLIPAKSESPLNKTLIILPPAIIGYIIRFLKLAAQKLCSMSAR